MAEQTNFCAVQRGAQRSFKPVSDGVINLYLYNFGSNLGVAFVERPSNPWVKRPWNCIFRVKNIVFSSAMVAIYLDFRIFFLSKWPSLPSTYLTCFNAICIQNLFACHDLCLFLHQADDSVINIPDFSPTVQGVVWENWPLDKVII